MSEIMAHAIHIDNEYILNLQLLKNQNFPCLFSITCEISILTSSCLGRKLKKGV